MSTLPDFTLPRPSAHNLWIAWCSRPTAAERWDELGARGSRGREEKGSICPCIAPSMQQAPKPTTGNTHLSPRHWAPACFLINGEARASRLSGCPWCLPAGTTLPPISLPCLQGPHSPLICPPLSAELDVGTCCRCSGVDCPISSADSDFPGVACSPARLLSVRLFSACLRGCYLTLSFTGSNPLISVRLALWLTPPCPGLSVLLAPPTSCGPACDSSPYCLASLAPGRTPT